MQVDLYDRTLMGRTKRQIKQISTRQYVMKKKYTGLEGARQYFRNDDQFNVFREKIYADLKRYGQIGRKAGYTEIGQAMNDSLFDVESLGIAEGAQDYVMIADYSDCLDYVLHRLCRCKMEDIRSINDYTQISKAITNYDFDEIAGVPFSKLALASNEIESYLAKLSQDSKTVVADVSKRATWVAYQFYLDIFYILSTIKYYTTVVVCNSFLKDFGHKGIIRSTSFSKIIATTSGRFDEFVTLHSTDDPQIEDYRVVYRTYAPYEYLGEVILKNELSRKI